MQSPELENVGMPSEFHRLLAKMTKIEKKNKSDFFVTIIRWVDFTFIERVNKEP